MIQLLSDGLYELLKFSRGINSWSFPTNPITAILYLIFTFYGYRKLKPYTRNKPLAFLYAGCILGFTNFIMENVWLTLFYVKYHYFNNGWLEYPYLSEPLGWYVNYYRNFALMVVLGILSRDAFKHIRFNRKTLFGMFVLSIFLYIDFFYTKSYAEIDWSYGIYYNFSKQIVLKGFLVGLAGKPIFYYIYRSIWKNGENR